MIRPRPLDGFSSIKLKWSIVILAAVGVPLNSRHAEWTDASKSRS